MERESDSAKAKAKNQEGRKLGKAKDYAAARACFSEAIAYHPEPRYFNNRALCNLRLAKYDDAIVDATKAMEGLESSSVAYGTALYRRLLAYAALDKWASANLDVATYLKQQAHYQLQPVDLKQILAIRQAASAHVRRLNALVLCQVNRWLREEQACEPIPPRDFGPSWFDGSVEQRLQDLPPEARKKLLEGGSILEAGTVGYERVVANPPASPSASSNDKEHLAYIVDYLDFLARWNRAPPLFLPTDSADFTSALADSGLFACREGFMAIAQSVRLLGRETRRQADRMIQAPMSCFTIEALGSALLTLTGYEALAAREEKAALEAKLHELLRGSEFLVEAAIPDILKTDLPKMRSIFAHLLSPHDPAPKATRFIATKALVDHLNDARTLQRLLPLSYLLDEPYTPTEVAREVDGNPKAILRKNGLLKRIFTEEPLTIRPWHAAARLLQLIGELLGSLSKRTRALHDPLIPFDDFEVVRHGLTHPEEHGWDQVSANLLRGDNLRLRDVIDEVSSQLPDRLLDLIAKRWPLDGDISWRQLYEDEESASRQAPPARVPAAESVQPTARKKKTKAQRQALKEEEARQRKAKKEAEEEAQRAARKSAGFDLIGALAQEFRGHSTSPPRILPPIELVRLAHQALQTVHEYLFNDLALRPSLSPNWEQDRDKKQQFYERLCDCPELHHAIEFTGGQAAHLLLCLYDGHNCESAETKVAREAIVNTLTAATALEADTLRPFRNYIAHGDPLVDLPDPHEYDGPPVRPRHFIAPQVARLVTTMLPVLQQLSLTDTASPQPLFHS